MFFLQLLSLIKLHYFLDYLKLLNHLNISKPLISYYKQNEKIKSNILIEKVLNGENIAVVSDAGTPGISDPGQEIVKEAIKNNIEVLKWKKCGQAERAAR